MHSSTASYLEIAHEKQEQRRQRIPKAWLLSHDQLQSGDILGVPERCGILTDREIHITQDKDAVDIVGEIAKGNLSAKEVTVAFCKRAAIAQQLVSIDAHLVFEIMLTTTDQLLDRDILQ